MATLQTTLMVPDLADVVLSSWYCFLSTLGPNDVGPHVGPTSASFVSSWSTLSGVAREHAKQSLDFIIFDMGKHLGKHLDEVVDLAAIPELHAAHEKLRSLRKGWTPSDKLQRVLERSSSDNLTVAVQSLGELKSFMLIEHKDFARELASGDIFDPFVGQILSALFAAASRDGDDTETLRLLAFECISILGAVDPDRCEIGFSDPRIIMLNNFTDEGESVVFALHLVKDVLVGAFRSTSDIKYQSHLAYSIQELLRFCKFTPALVASGTTTSVPLKVRHRWNSLPKHVLETVTPLLEARFTLNQKPPADLTHPIYSNQSTYREWIQIWTGYLITEASGATAQTIFSVFRSVVRNKDVGVAHHLLPHLVLNILISGNEEAAQNIRDELLVVLEDQVNSNSGTTADKKLLSAQVRPLPYTRSIANCLLLNRLSSCSWII
jgi:serine/threonine-protein kinase ATR